MDRNETWETPEKIRAAMDRFAAMIPGWELPAAYGVVFVPADRLGSSDVEFPVVNVGAHGLPALVLGVLTGRSHESCTHEVSPGDLSRGIEMLAPAEGARMYRHPNLAAWRTIAEQVESEPDGKVFAVFIADLDDRPTSLYDRALRRQIANGERSELYA